MADFTKTSVSQSARREYTAMADLATFTSTLATFNADTTMGFSKVQGAVSYKTEIEYFDAAGNSKGTVTIQLADTTAFSEMKSLMIGNEATETAAGVGGTPSLGSVADEVWSAKFSCINVVNGVNDNFNVTIYRDYMLISGFSYDATLAALETWADTIPALGGSEE